MTTNTFTPSRRLVLGTSAVAAVAAGAVQIAPQALALSGTSIFPNLTVTCSAQWHLARRACMAPTMDIRDQIAKLGITAWLERQLDPAAIDDSRVERIIAANFPVVNLAAPKQIVDATGQRPWEAAPAMRAVTALRHLYGERHLQESMADFFSNQIYVSSLGKGDSYIAHFNEMMRRMSLGKFKDLLHAATKHPAVTVSLDAHTSTKTNPNENLGRELLELHTMGVGNYTEADVRNATLLLTGHSMAWATYDYVYRPENHHVGALKIVGFSHPNTSAEAGYVAIQLRAFTDYLATHPATAKRLMTRLAIRFVSDVPPAALVDRLVKVYLANDTAMVPVLRALFTSNEFIAAKGQKVRRGQEALGTMVRTLRPADPTITATNPYAKLSTHAWYLELLNHGVREWPVVDGYPDTGAHWSSTAKIQALANVSEAVFQRWDQDEIPSMTLRARMGVAPGAPVFRTARRLTELFTGWSWTTQDVAEVASWLYAGRPGVAVPSTAVLTDRMLDEFLPLAARVTVTSPHFLAR